MNTITEKVLRELVIEALDDSMAGSIYAPEKDPNEPAGGAKVNAVVDPSAMLTDPMNPDHKPQNAVELGVAVKQLTDNMPDEQASRVYDTVKSSLDDQKKSDELDAADPDNETKEDEMDNSAHGTTSGTKSGTTAEARVRMTVRQLLREEWNAEDEPDEDELPKSSEVDSDDDERSFDEIAQELGMSVAGAKQFVDKAMARWKFLGNQPSSALKSKQTTVPTHGPGASDTTLDVTSFEPPESGLEDVDVLLLKAWGDYIELMNSSGELTPADVQLMHDHPEVSLELDGFREFASEYIMGAAEPQDAKGEKWLGTLPNDKDPNLNPDKPEGKRAGTRTFQNAPKYGGDFDWIDDDESKYGKVKRKAAARAIRSSQQGPSQGGQ